MKTKFKYVCAVMVIGLLVGCQNSEKKTNTENVEKEVVFQNDAHELVYDMVQKVGNDHKLKALKDVVFTYTYRTPDGKEDISKERYVFDGELSSGVYSKHERTLPQLVGAMRQSYNGNEFFLTQDGNLRTEAELLKSVAFTRKTNYFWFTMMQKMLDPGIQYEFLREETLNEVVYDVVKISYELSTDQESDVYHLYMNRNTGLVDQFLFTVVAHHIVDEPLIMKVSYKNIQGILVPAYRKYTKAKWDGSVIDENAWVEEISEHIQFNINIKKEFFNN